MALAKHAFATFLCVMVLGAMPATQAAITCGAVSSALAPCIGYLTGQSGPSSDCCGGIKSLAGMTPVDKKAACQCMQSAAGTIPGLNYGNAAALGTKCGVAIPFKITPNSIDCSTLN